jgi:hypothetical protein
MSLASAIKRSTQFGLWLHAHYNESEWKCDDKQRGTLALLQHVLDLGDAVIVLVDKRLPGPALTLARPLFEGYVRSYWLSRIATSMDSRLRGNDGYPFCGSLTLIAAACGLGSAVTVGPFHY